MIMRKKYIGIPNGFRHLRSVERAERAERAELEPVQQRGVRHVSLDRVRQLWGVGAYR
jgi:hypothetical protein